MEKSQLIKLLKEKGYNPYFYIKEHSGNEWIMEIALAIEWIRVNFGGIQIRYDRQVSTKNKFEYYYEIKSGDGFNTEPIYSGTFKTPQEATEAALNYVLSNLI